MSPASAGSRRTPTRGRRAPLESGPAGRDLVIQTFVVSRGLLFATALWVIVRHHKSINDAIANWDVQHYLAIARDGYADPTNRAFFPGLPAVLHVASSIGMSPTIFGALVSLIASGFAAAALFRMGGAVAACLWLVAPMTVFTFVPYTEAPFCAFAFWAWERARNGRWWQAGVLAAAACTLRVSGVFLIGGLVLLALGVNRERAGSRRPVNRAINHRSPAARVLPMLLPVAVVALYVVYLHHASGSWTAWYDAQRQGWTRGFASPLNSLQNTINAAKESSWPGRRMVAWVFGAELVVMSVGLVTTLACALRRWWAEAAYVAVQLVVFGTSYWYMSICRAALLWFPLFLLVAELLAWQPRTIGVRVVRTGLVAVAAFTSLLLSVGWAWLFFTGNWAG